MDFDITIAATDPERARALVSWLREDATVDRWDLRRADGADGPAFRVSGDGTVPARFAQSLISWFIAAGAAGRDVTVTVTHRPSGRQVTVTREPAAHAALRQLVAEPAPGNAGGPPPRPDDNYTDDFDGSVTAGPTPDIHHTSPGPVLDPDDDWARDAEES